MEIANIPAKFPIPWADAAVAPYIRAVPETSQIGIQAGAASLTDGFPPATFTPESAGGTPPWGADTNGILNQITAWLQYAQAGGAVLFDAGFASDIGGYPEGAILASTTNGQFWQSTADNNTTDPDGLTPANWISVGSGAVQAQAGNYAADSGAADAYVVALSPAISAYAGGLVVRFIPAHTNTGASTINVNGEGVKSIVYADGSALAPGAIPATGLSTAVYQATLGKFVLTSFTPPVTSGNATAGTLVWPGTTYKLKWQTVSVAQPGSSSDLFTGGYAQTNNWAWDTPFITVAIGAWASYPVVANGNCIVGVAQNTSLSGGTLWTTTAQNIRAVGNTVIIGFGI